MKTFACFIVNRLDSASLPVIEIQESLLPASQRSSSQEQVTPKAVPSLGASTLLAAAKSSSTGAAGVAGSADVSGGTGTSPPKPHGSEEASVPGSREDPNVSAGSGSLAWDERGTNTPLVSVETTIRENLRSLLEELETHVELNDREKSMLLHISLNKVDV